VSDQNAELNRWVRATGELPGLARIVAATTVRTMAWTAGSYVRSGRLMARALTDRQAADQLLQEVAFDVAVAARAVSNVARAVADGVPISRALLDGGATLAQVIPEPVDVVEPAHEPTLRERGEELLERSRDVWSEEESHPAYVRILEDLAPDEARILVHLLREGPEPAVDVRTGGPIRRVSSTLVASGLTMIGPRAGVRYGDEVPAYLNNLVRLGLVWFSSEQVDDARDYQVLEVQPDVLEAMHSVRFPRLVRRSIHLTPFGINLCRTCLVDAEELPDLPEHGAPED
jgi:hypothetical protein